MTTFTPGKRDLTVWLGSIFEHKIILKDAASTPLDLTGKTARMQIRKTKKAFSVIAELTTENGRIVLGGTDGSITITLDAIATTTLNNGKGLDAVYDIELVTSSTVIDRVLEGKIKLDREVTR